MDANFFAFSDQDDYWYPDKLERSIRFISHLPKENPILYGSRTEIVDKDRKKLGFSKTFQESPNFIHSLIENFAGGNTMLFNRKARETVCKTIKCTEGIILHDWWFYIIISGCGGHVLYDSYPTIQYRQHDKNIIGVNRPVDDRFKNNTGWYIKCLQSCREILTPENNSEILPRAEKFFFNALERSSF